MIEVNSIKGLKKAIDNKEEKVIIKSPSLLSLCIQADELVHIAYSPLSFKRLLVFFAKAFYTIRLNRSHYLLVMQFINKRIKLKMMEEYVAIYYFYYYE